MTRISLIDTNTSFVLFFMVAWFAPNHMFTVLGCCEPSLSISAQMVTVTVYGQIVLYSFNKTPSYC